jgi:hypothetical protein
MKFIVVPAEVVEQHVERKFADDGKMFCDYNKEKIIQALLGKNLSFLESKTKEDVQLHIFEKFPKSKMHAIISYKNSPARSNFDQIILFNGKGYEKCIDINPKKSQQKSPFSRSIYEKICESIENFLSATEKNPKLILSFMEKDINFTKTVVDLLTESRSAEYFLQRIENIIGIIKLDSMIKDRTKLLLIMNCVGPYGFFSLFAHWYKNIKGLRKFDVFHNVCNSIYVVNFQSCITEATKKLFLHFAWSNVVDLPSDYKCFSIIPLSDGKSIIYSVKYAFLLRMITGLTPEEVREQIKERIKKPKVKLSKRHKPRIENAYDLLYPQLSNAKDFQDMLIKIKKNMSLVKILCEAFSKNEFLQQKSSIINIINIFITDPEEQFKQLYKVNPELVILIKQSQNINSITPVQNTKM